MSALLTKLGLILLNNAQEKLIAFVLTLLTGLLDKALDASGVKWGVLHGFSFSVPQTNGKMGNFHTGTIFLQNSGRHPVNNIEVYLNYKPEHMQIWPPLIFEEKNTRENHHCIHINSLGRGEWLQIEMVSGISLPDVLRVRTPTGECKKVNWGPAPVYSKTQRLVAVSLLTFGFFNLVYYCILFIQALLN